MKVIEKFIATTDLTKALLAFGKDDYRQAKSLFEKLAPKNDPIAQDKLGEIYYFGYGVEADLQKAIDWCQKSADQGYAVAQRHTAMFFASKNDHQKCSIRSKTYR